MRRSSTQVQEAILAALDEGPLPMKAVRERARLSWGAYENNIKLLERAGKVSREPGRRGRWMKVNGAAPQKARISPDSLTAALDNLRRVLLASARTKDLMDEIATRLK